MPDLSAAVVHRAVAEGGTTARQQMSNRAQTHPFWIVTLAVLALRSAALRPVSTGCARCRPAVTLPVAPARKGDFLVIVRCRGELRARRSVQI